MTRSPDELLMAFELRMKLKAEAELEAGALKPKRGDRNFTPKDGYGPTPEHILRGFRGYNPLSALPKRAWPSPWEVARYNP